MRNSLLQPVEVSPDVLGEYQGTYRFGPNAVLKITIADGKLILDPGTIEFFDLAPNRPVFLEPISTTEFYIESRYLTRISFERDSSGAITKALINPGRWQQGGIRDSDRSVTDRSREANTAAGHRSFSSSTQLWPCPTCCTNLSKRIGGKVFYNCVKNGC